jgi:hypothetical protein
MRDSQRSIDASERRQLIMLGAAMASAKVRESLEPKNFADASISKCLSEIQNGEPKEAVRLLLASIKVTAESGGVLSSIRDTVHLDGRAANMRRIAQLMQTSLLNDQASIDRLKTEMANV